jgi:DNA-binding protein H-NS
MAKLDISGLSLEELSSLIDEATKLRAQKVEAKRQELQKQLAALDALDSGEKKTTSRPSAKAMYRAPSGYEWSGRGAIPRVFKELGVETKADMAKYAIKD